MPPLIGEKGPLTAPATPVPRRPAPPSVALLALAEGLPSDYYLG
jgi:hypothetical protein